MSEKKVSSIVARAMNSLQWRRGNGNDDTHAIEIKGNKLALLQKPGKSSKTEKLNFKNLVIISINILTII
jgi:hypothetical protein